MGRAVGEWEEGLLSLTGGRWSFRTWRTEKHALPEFRTDAIDTEQCATQSLRPKGDSRWTGVGRRGRASGPWEQPMDSPWTGPTRNMLGAKTAFVSLLHVQQRCTFSSLNRRRW